MPAASTDRRKELLPALGALALAILFWSSVPLLLKHFTQTLDAWTVNGIRYTFAALFWMPYVLKHLHEIPRGSRIWRDAVPPAIVHFIGQVLFALTPYFNDATVINFASRSSFVFTTLLGFWLVREERTLARSPLFWIAFAGNVAGLAAMYAGGLGTESTSAAGMLLLVVTAALWGFYSVLVRRCMGGHSIRLSFGIISLYVVPGLLVLMFAVGNWRQALHLGPGYWALLWISAVAGIALGHVTFYRAIHTLGPIASDGALLLIPFATAILAYALLDERLTRLQWIGGCVLVLGCLFLLVAKARAFRRTAIVDQSVTMTTD